MSDECPTCGSVERIDNGEACARCGGDLNELATPPGSEMDAVQSIADLTKKHGLEKTQKIVEMAMAMMEPIKQRYGQKDDTVLLTVEFLWQSVRRSAGRDIPNDKRR